MDPDWHAEDCQCPECRPASEASSSGDDGSQATNAGSSQSSSSDEATEPQSPEVQTHPSAASNGDGGGEGSTQANEVGGQLFVIDLHGRTHVLNGVQVGGTVDTLLGRIIAKLKMSGDSSDFRLVVEGKQLDPNAPCELVDGQTVRVLGCLRGGMPSTKKNKKTKAAGKKIDGDDDNVPVMEAWGDSFSWGRGQQHVSKLMGRSCHRMIIHGAPADMQYTVGTPEHREEMLGRFPGMKKEYYNLLYVEKVHLVLEKLDRQGKCAAGIKMLKKPELQAFLLWHMEMTYPALPWKLVHHKPFRAAYPDAHARMLLKERQGGKQAAAAMERADDESSDDDMPGLVSNSDGDSDADAPGQAEADHVSVMEVPKAVTIFMGTDCSGYSSDDTVPPDVSSSDWSSQSDDSMSKYNGDDDDGAFGKEIYRRAKNNTTEVTAILFLSHKFHAELVAKVRNDLAFKDPYLSLMQDTEKLLAYCLQRFGSLVLDSDSDDAIMHYDLPEDTIAECLAKSVACDKVGDYEVAHLAEDKALKMFVCHVAEGKGDTGDRALAISIADHLTRSGTRWYA